MTSDTNWNLDHIEWQVSQFYIIILADNTNPLPKSVLTCHKWNYEEHILITISLTWVWDINMIFTQAWLMNWFKINCYLWKILSVLFYRQVVKIAYQKCLENDLAQTGGNRENSPNNSHQ